jgi:multicomponent Na+:H+ antiporter subunit B
MLPVLLLFSIFVLVRGHNDPGGGFTGGLVAASAFALYALGASVAGARQALRLDPHNLVGAGLLLALGSGMWALFIGKPFLTEQWVLLHIPTLGEIEIGTPLIFDVGVYLVVLGVTLMIVLALAEE